MVSTKEKEILLCLLKLYKEMPHLWDKSNKHYNNNNMRQEAYESLLEIYKDLDEQATIPKLKKKIQNMRTNYIKEEKKVNASMHSSADTKDIYKPTLWYYSVFKSLGIIEEPSHPGQDILEKNEDSSSSPEVEKPLSQASPVYLMPKNKRKRKISVLDKHENVLDSVRKRMETTNEEKWEVYGKCIGLQLRGIDSEQLIITQKLISDAIFYGKTGKLSVNSYIALGSFSRRKSVPTIYIRHKQSHSRADSRSSHSNVNNDDFDSNEEDCDEQS